MCLISRLSFLLDSSDRSWSKLEPNFVPKDWLLSILEPLFFFLWGEVFRLDGSLLMTLNQVGLNRTCFSSTCVFASCFRRSSSSFLFLFFLDLERFLHRWFFFLSLQRRLCRWGFVFAALCELAGSESEILLQRGTQPIFSDWTLFHSNGILWFIWVRLVRFIPLGKEMFRTGKNWTKRSFVPSVTMGLPVALSGWLRSRTRQARPVLRLMATYSVFSGVECLIDVYVLYQLDSMFSRKMQSACNVACSKTKITNS